MVHDTQRKRKQRYVLLATIRIKRGPRVTAQRDAAGVIRIGDSKIQLKSWSSIAQHLHTPLDTRLLLNTHLWKFLKRCILAYAPIHRLILRLTGSNGFEQDLEGPPIRNRMMNVSVQHVRLRIYTKP